MDVRLKNMTLEEKLEKIVAEEAHNAYLLLIDIGPGDWREEPDRHHETIANFRATFDDCVKKIEASFGPPSYIEREYSKHSPDWAPMGLYADWAIESSGSVICIFMGGDGNPEDPMMLIGGRTSGEARMSPDDPWGWQWIE